MEKSPQLLFGIVVMHSFRPTEISVGLLPFAKALSKWHWIENICELGQKLQCFSGLIRSLFQNSSKAANIYSDKGQQGPFAQCDSVLTGQNRAILFHTTHTILCNTDDRAI